MIAQAEIKPQAAIDAPRPQGVSERGTRSRPRVGHTLSRRDGSGDCSYDSGRDFSRECGTIVGDEAVIHILKSCVKGGEGVYKSHTGPRRHSDAFVARRPTILGLDGP